MLGRAPLVAQRIHLPMQETQGTLVQSLGQEDPLEEEMATHASILAWKIPWTEEPGGPQSMGPAQESDKDNSPVVGTQQTPGER